ncbi:unnamed protein product [Brassica oleracea]|uniref:(rape) hypothetical protein n=1 Tax=Brassica napus TaxID=3708 RepID=A0A816N0Z4_BRANA|nr:unnamed protein product [Brassica napus]
MRITPEDKPPSTQRQRDTESKPTVHFQRIGATSEPKTDRPLREKCVVGRRANHGEISPEDTG